MSKIHVCSGPEAATWEALNTRAFMIRDPATLDPHDSVMIEPLALNPFSRSLVPFFKRGEPRVLWSVVHNLALKKGAPLQVLASRVCGFGLGLLRVPDSRAEGEGKPKLVGTDP